MRTRWALQAGWVITGETEFAPGYVVVEGRRIVAVRPGQATRPDVAFPKSILAPGFIDLQVNGCAGVDFLSVESPEDLRPASAHLLRTGVTSYLPTLISSPIRTVRRAMGVLAAAARRRDEPRILGIHLEGPFLNREYAGAHDPAHLRRPSLRVLGALLEGFETRVRLITLAPELPGAGELIRRLARTRIRLAAGHSGADFQTASGAFDDGIVMATHLFNAMRPFHHREPGLAGATLVHRAAFASLILDGVHVHKAAAQVALHLLGRDRAILITDAIAAAGASPGRYRLGGREVDFDGRAPRTASGALAGSTLTMNAAVANAVRLGVSLPDAIRMAATNPARLLGLRKKGVLAAGADADLVVLTPNLEVEVVAVQGGVVYRVGTTTV